MGSIEVKIRDIIVLIIPLLSGCMARSAFSPPPDAYEHWVKPGVDKVSIWKDMLECNYAEPFGGGRVIEGGRRTFDEVAASMICMEKIGYAYTSNGRVEKVCDVMRESRYCPNGFLVPPSDINARLNGGYCKKYPKSDACVP
jgi:hypothetical protein